MFFLLLLILLFSFIYISLFSFFFFPTRHIKQLLRALFGSIGSSSNPWDKHFTATRVPRIYNLQLSLPRQPLQVRTCLTDFFLGEHVFIQEMLQQNLSKVCGALCPKATKPAFSSRLGFFSTLTNFVSQHP